MTVTIDSYVQNNPGNIKYVSDGVLMTFIFSDILWPDLDPNPFKYDLRTRTPSDAYCTLVDFELNAIRLTDRRAQNVKMVSLTFDLTLT